MHLDRQLLHALHLLPRILQLTQDQFAWVFSLQFLQLLGIYYQFLLLHVSAVEVLETLDKRGHQFLSRRFHVLRDELFHVEIVVFKDLPVVGPRSEFCKADCSSFGEDTPLTNELIVVGLYFIVLLSHGGHAQSPLVDQIFEHLHILFELF